MVLIYAVIYLSLYAALIKELRKSVVLGKLLVLLKLRHKLHGRIVNILHHEHKSEILFGTCHSSAEDQFYPYILALEVLHLAVKRGRAAAVQILFQIFGIRDLKELLFILRPDHVHRHHAPIGILNIRIYNFFRNLCDTYAAGRIVNKVNIHGKKKCILNCSVYLAGSHVLLNVFIIQFIHDVNILRCIFYRINSHLKDGRRIAPLRKYLYLPTVLTLEFAIV